METADETRRRKGNWFRIGFEPLFVDFIKSGTVFVVVSLFEVRASYLAVKYEWYVLNLPVKLLVSLNLDPPEKCSRIPKATVTQ